MKNFGAQLLLCGLSLTAVFTGCRNEDVYVGDVDEVQYRKTFNEEFGKVDPEHTWNMAVQAKADISLYGIDALSEYQVKICSGNPLFDKNARLLADYKVSTDASGNYQNSFDFDLPQGLTSVCVVLYDAHNRPLCRDVNVNEDKSVKIQFGSEPLRLGRSISRAEVNAKLYTFPYNAEDGYDGVKNQYSGYTIIEIDGIDDETDFSSIAEGGYYLVHVTKDFSFTTFNAIPMEIVFYVDNGATLTFDDSQGMTTGSRKREFIIGNGGEFMISGSRTIPELWGSRLVVFPQGKVTYDKNSSIEKINIGNADVKTESVNPSDFDKYRPIVFNKGIIDFSGLNFEFYSNSTFPTSFYNEGVLRAKAIVGTTGGGNGNVNVDFVNDGKIFCDYFGTDGTNSSTTNGQIKLTNNCLLDCKYTLMIKDLVMGNQSMVEVQTIKQDSHGAITMGTNSILKADIAYMLWDGLEYGISGPTDGYCLFSCPHICGNFQYSNGVNPQMMFEGNIYFEVAVKDNIEGDFIFQNENSSTADNHLTENCFKSHIKTNPSTFYTYIGGAPFYAPGVDYDRETITDEEIMNLPCVGEGNAPKDPDPIIPTIQPHSWTIAYEDLGGKGDFDFNDVVLKVSHTASNNAAVAEAVTVTLMAAGGTLPAQVAYKDGNNEEQILFNEVHESFGVSVQQMINTIGGNRDQKPSVDKTLTVSGFSMSACAPNFMIRVKRNGDTEYRNEIAIPQHGGEPPMAFVVSGDWEWPEEYQDIRKKYTGFETWVKNHLNTNWYDTTDQTMPH